MSWIGDEPARIESYTVNVTREGDNWLADVPQVEGTHTYAKSLRQLDAEVREAIAVALDLDEDAEAGLDLEYEIRSGNDELDLQAAKVRRLRAAVVQTEAVLAQTTPKVVAGLLKNKQSVRDVAFQTGLSPQRISQIKQEVGVE